MRRDYRPFDIEGGSYVEIAEIYRHRIFGGKFAKLLLPYAMKNYKETRSGMLRDILAGKRCDVDFVAGAAVQAGKRCGVPTPMLERAVSLVHDVENGIAEIAPETLRLFAQTQS